MRKRILSLVLVAVMLVSLFAAYPMTVSAETATDTWNPDNGVYKISTTADMVAFRNDVADGNTFSGKTYSTANQPHANTPSALKQKSPQSERN